VRAVVRHLRDCGSDSLDSGHGSVSTSLDSEHGCPRLIQRLVSYNPGSLHSARELKAFELWYVFQGKGTLKTETEEAILELRPGTALHLKPGNYEVDSLDSHPLDIVIVVLPNGTENDHFGTIEAHLETCEVERTGDRQFRVLIGPNRGFETATQFIGDIPPGRAPMHEHTYDEVVMVLEGRGVVHLDDGDWPLERGTCIYLPPGTKHCLENDGNGMLRVLGVFHPGGSPASKLEALS